ncbi:phosphatase domain-containing putative toxin [Tautonia sociabilis]|nr:hypothetical protein [Tautonia sociabilis]
MRGRTRRRIALLALALLATAGVSFRHDLFEKRVVVLAPGQLVRGAWQRPRPLRRLIARERIRTIVTLTAINTHDPKYVDQQRVVRQTGVDWIIVPMRGSTATIEQLAEAADLLADPARQPVFFHCVGGHHRTNLALAAYRIRHQGWSADRAWEELERFPWTEPEDQFDDRRLIEAFAASPFARPEESQNGSRPDRASGPRRVGLGDDRGLGPGGLALDDRQRGRH